MDQGEEAGSASLKRDRNDFALWKAQKPGEDSSWPSPWGQGRPGWHIECSAMAEQLLGLDFAIHGGGADLVFPHHENEIAQTESARGAPLARIWMHNGMVLAGPEAKMAKSEGNVFLLHEAIDRYGRRGGDRLPGLRPLPPADRLRRAGVRAGARPKRAPARLLSRRRADRWTQPIAASRRVREAFLGALADDFNTPRAMAELYDLVSEGNKRQLAGAHATLEELLGIVGLESLAADEEHRDAEAGRLLDEREAARAERDFERADRIRAELDSRGWLVRDTPAGARLVRKAESP